MNAINISPEWANKKTAVIVGVLYIIGTVTGILSVVFTGPVLNAPDYLGKISANENQIALGAILVLTMGFALAMVPVMLYQTLKQHNAVLALGYVVFRGALETVSYIAMVITWLFLLILGQEYVRTGVSDVSYFQTLGTLLLKGHDSINIILIMAFSLGALMLYFVFYQSNLIPRWISGWGIFAILLHLATGFLIIFHINAAFSTLNIVMNIPILLQEMVMAVWLIFKGFNPSAIASESVKVNIH